MVVEGDEISLKKVVLDYLFFKGFVVGVVFLYVNKRLILGFVVGILIGVYI